MMPGDDEFKEIGGSDINETVDAGVSELVVDETESVEASDNTVTVQPVQFASFEDLDQVQGPQNQNLNILLDVKLQLTV